MTKRMSVLAFSLAGLSACGGSGGDGIPSFEGYDAAELFSETLAFDERFERVNPTMPSDLPTSGTARLQGVASLGTGSLDDFTAVALGESAILVDFGDGSLRGRAGNFYTLAGGGETPALRGTLSFSGDIDEKTASVGGSVGGTLRGDEASIEVEADFEGVFGGSSAQSLVIGGEGTTTVDGVAAPAAIIMFAD